MKSHLEQKNIGYDVIDKHFVVNKKEQENLINLYKYLINVNGDIQKTYSNYFIPNFLNKGQDAMYNYLRDTSYIGLYKLYRKDVYLENYIPRLMSDDLFYTVQNLLKKKERTSKVVQSPSLFSGIVFCNICKNRMCKKQDNRVKTRLIRYTCDNASRRKVGSMEYKCDNHKLIREEKIEEYLLNNLKELAKQYISKNSPSTEIRTNNGNEKLIKDIERKINKLKDLYLDDLIDKATYKSDYENLNKQLNNLKMQDPTPVKKDFSKLKEYINTDICKIYSKLTIEQKRTVWINVVDKIYIENGEIKEVTFL